MNILISNESIVEEAKGMSYFHVKGEEIRSVDPSNAFSYVIVGNGKENELVTFLGSLGIPFVLNGKWANENPIKGFPE